MIASRSKPGSRVRQLKAVLVATACLLWTHALPADETRSPLENKILGLDKRLAKDLSAEDKKTLADGGVPDSDQFFAAIRPRLADYQEEATALEKRIAHLQKSASPKFDAELKRLGVLQTRVNRLITKGNQFSAGSKWGGSLALPRQTFEVELEITESEGATFIGTLTEKPRGGSSEVRGVVKKGNLFEMRTTGTERGKTRHRQCEGEIQENGTIEAKVKAMRYSRKGKAINEEGALKLKWIRP